tara:strand:- start:1561 stop:2346 length:786 start_codon:yes stop_codon:yes gene_type:complete
MKRLIAAALAAASCTIAHADSELQLPRLVESAFNAGADAPEEAQWQFTLTADMGEHGGFVARFDSAQADDARWTLIEPASAEDLSDTAREAWTNMSTPDDDEDTSDDAAGDDGEEARSFSIGGSGSGLYFGRDGMELVAGGVAELRNTPSQVIYSFLPDLTDDDGDDSMGEAMAEYLRGELTISRNNPFVELLRIHAPESFKPNFMVRIHAFEMEMEFERLAGHPAPVMTRFLTHVEASAMMQRVNQHMEFRFSDIVVVNP